MIKIKKYLIKIILILVIGAIVSIFNYQNSNHTIRIDLEKTNLIENCTIEKINNNK